MGLHPFRCFQECSLSLSRENKSNGSIVHNFPVIGPHYTGIERGSCLAMHGALVAIGTRFTGAVYVYHLVGEWENQVYV